MKHKPVIVTAGEIRNTTSYSLDEIDEYLPTDCDDDDLIEVRWPDHVINPKYNADANYLSVNR